MLGCVTVLPGGTWVSLYVYHRMLGRHALFLAGSRFGSIQVVELEEESSQMRRGRDSFTD